jgi:DNA repair protein RadC
MNLFTGDFVERVLLEGSFNVSTKELIVSLLDCKDKQEKASEILGMTENVGTLNKVDLYTLIHDIGLDEVNAGRIFAALELGRRVSQERAKERLQIRKSETIFEYMKPICGYLPHEEFWVLFLDQSLSLLKKKCFSKGGLSGTVVDVRMILKEALFCNATIMVLVHNHPSGNARASEADKKITDKLKNSGKMMEVEVIDHVIVAGDDYVSFADDGLI